METERSDAAKAAATNAVVVDALSTGFAGLPDAAIFAATSARSAAHTVVANTAASAANAAAYVGAHSGSADAADSAALHGDDSALVGKICARPLWPGGPPEDLLDNWSTLKAALPKDEDWAVWTDWYEDRLYGRPYDLALEEARVLEITDEDWEQGPAHVNAKIKRLIEAHRAQAQRSPRPMSIEALLETPSLRIALAEFDYDDLSGLMKMVRFDADLAALDEQGVREAARDDLQALAEDASDLVEDAVGDRRNVASGFQRDLRRYADHANRGLDRFLPRRLWSLGATLGRWRRDEDLRWGLGDILAAKLDDLCEAHLDLMRVYFAAALARLRDADKIALAPGADAADLLEPLEKARDLLDEGDWSRTPGMTEEARAVFAMQVEEIRADMAARAEARTDERRAELDRDGARKGKVACATLFRFGLQSAKHTKDGAAVAADIKTLFPDGWDAVAARLKELTSDFSQL